MSDMVFGARLVLKDNMSETAKATRKRVKELRDEIDKTDTAVRKVGREKVQVQADAKKVVAARKEVDKTTQSVKKASKEKIKVNADAKKAKQEIDGAKKKLKEAQDMAKKKMELKMQMRDGVTGGLGKIGSGLSSVGRFAGGAASALLKVGTIAAGVFAGLVAGAVAVGGKMVERGMMLEKQTVSMQHFIGVNNEGMTQAQVAARSGAFMKQLRQNADVTPFETDEVVAAGSRGLGIMGGDTKKAMELVKMAEDMAALTPGKSLSDAMEALADLKTGETERMKEFGFKITQKDMKKAGGAENVMMGQIAPYFAGGAAKMGKTSAGLMSTITGGLLSSVTDMGKSMLDGMRPLLERLVPLVNRITPLMGKVGEALGKGIAQVSPIVEILVNKFIEFAQSGALLSIVKGLSNAGNTVVSFIGVFQQIRTAVEPILSKVIEFALHLGTGLVGAIQQSLPSIQGFINTFLTAGAGADGFLTKIVDFVSTSLPPLVSFIMTTASQLVEFLAPILSPILDIFSGVVEWFSANMPFFSGLIGSIFAVVGPAIQDVVAVVKRLWDIWLKVWPSIQRQIEVVWGIIGPIFSILWDAIMIIWDGLQPFVDAWISGFQKILSFVQPILDAIGKGLQWVADKFHEQRVSAEQSAGVGTNSERGYAYGISRVPYNGFPVKLHEGERVLTKGEVNRGMGRGGNISIAKLADQIIVREEADIDRLATAFVEKLKDTALVYGEG